MKICMIGHKTVPSREGGVEIVVEELATRMAQSGCSVVLYNRKRSNKTSASEYKGVKLKDVFTIDKKATDAIVYANIATNLAIKEAKKGNLDVVHFHAEGPCNFLYKFGKPGSKKRSKMPKIVVTIHGLDWQRGKWNGIGSKILLRGEKQAVKYADEIIVLSRNNQKYFKDKYGRETVYIPNGIIPAETRKSEMIKEKWGLDENSYVLFLARLVPEKGVHYLIKAWKELKKEIKTEKKLVIAGASSHSTDYYNRIKKMVADDDSIIMTGFVSGQILQELYSNACLYVLPSDIEGMPMSLLEAMSYGNVCLVSNIPENTENIGDSCYIFEKGSVDDLKSKLIDLIDKKHVSHGKAKLIRSWDDIVIETLKIYERPRRWKTKK